MKFALLIAITLICESGIASERAIYFFHAADTFLATGKWASDSTNSGEKPAFQHEVEIDCFRAQRLCIEATAEFYMGNPHITLSYFNAMNWDGDGIIAIDSSGICATTKLLINFADQSITSVNSPVMKPDENVRQACEVLGGKRSVTWIFVAKGTERWEREHWEGILPPKK